MLRKFDVARSFKFSASSPLVDVHEQQGWRIDRFGLVKIWEWSIVGSLVILVLLGFSLRINQLGASGFAEDEMNKLDAIRSYQHGDFTANGEHPMVMKVLMWGSLNAVPASDEIALRLPNALFGALTVIPLFLLTAALFDRWTALLAAAFWAVGINAITHNRIGKEDTLLVFFMLFAFFFFVRAKQISPGDKQGYFFPHDEFYDDGLREAIKFVCEEAPNGATMAHETPGVARYYLAQFGRTDLQSQAVSSPEFDVRSINGPVYVIVQRGRTYFENREELDYVRTNFRRVHEVKIDGASAVVVFMNH